MTNGAPADGYVTNGAWHATASRPDTIDEIADQFERRDGAAAFWTELTVRRTSRDARLAPRAARRAG